MLIKSKDYFGREVAIGVGRVVARDGQNPLQQTVTKANGRLGFSVTVAIMNINGNYEYQTVPCAIYENKWSKQLWNIATSLKKNDTVQIMGVIHEGRYKDAETGAMKTSFELRIEWLMPLKLVEKLVKGGTDDIPTKDNTTDGVSTNPNERGIMF